MTTPANPHIRLAVLAAAILVALAAALFLALTLTQRRETSGKARIGAPFTLTDVNGARFESARLAGRPHAIFFGYTHCPDVCPTALLDLTQAIKTLGPAAERLAIVFISVDPPRDTPEAMKAYVETVNPAIIGLTGSEAEIAAVAKSFRVLYHAGPSDGGAYAVDHSAFIYLYDRSGEFVSVLASGDPQETMLTRLSEVLAR